ncbi:hypothetical protein [Methylophilus methylotrophus]|uniref:hypothetical protein n=1 Tax=Methylophilus methylotrophus TaxID=17 RepID=UPI00035EF78A|nr:hypothetical protein [Methylophilus methylotrophus]
MSNQYDIDDNELPTKAEHLASVIEGRGFSSYIGASIQRSHRFPFQQFIIIENMSKLADCSVSAMINEVIQVGIEAMYKELSPETIKKINFISDEQLSRASLNLNQSVGKEK